VNRFLEVVFMLFSFFWLFVVIVTAIAGGDVFRPSVQMLLSYLMAKDCCRDNVENGKNEQ
jgi:hypothetical protein